MTVTEKKKKSKQVKPLPGPKEDIQIEMLPCDEGILNDIAQVALDEWKQSHPYDKENREYYYHSDAGKCPRQLYGLFKYGAKKTDMKASTVMMFSMGNLFHDEMSRLLKKVGIVQNKHIEIGLIRQRDGFKKSGRLDMFIVVKDGKKRKLVPLAVTEVKSKSPYVFDVETPKQEEIDQGMSYVADAKSSDYFKDKYEIVDYFFILYVDRSGLGAPIPIRAWKIGYSESRMNQIDVWFAELWRAIKDNNTPPRPYERDSLACVYCRLSDRWCWKDVPKLKEAEVREPDDAPLPEKEIIESHVGNFLKNRAIELEAKKQKEFSLKVLRNYYRAKKPAQIVDENGVGVKFSETTGYALDEKYLWRKCRQFYHLIAKPGVTLIKEAIKDGLIDASVLERAKVAAPEAGITVTPIKPKPDKKTDMSEKVKNGKSKKRM